MCMYMCEPYGIHMHVYHICVYTYNNVYFHHGHHAWCRPQACWLHMLSAHNSELIEHVDSPHDLEDNGPACSWAPTWHLKLWLGMKLVSDHPAGTVT